MLRGHGDDYSLGDGKADGASRRLTNLVDLSRSGVAVNVGFGCSGAFNVGAGAVVVGDMTSFGAVTVGAGAKLTGKIDSVAAVTIGYEAQVSAGTSGTQQAITIDAGNTFDCVGVTSGGGEGGILSQSAITIAANGIVCGDVTSGGAVTVGALAELFGFVEDVGGITIGAGANHQPVAGGHNIITVGQLTASNSTNVINDIKYAYDEAIGKSGPSDLALVNIVGSTLTLSSGLYLHSGAFALDTSVTLKLDGGMAQGNSNAKWVIIVDGSCAIYGSVELINGAQASNVQWIVKGAFALATNKVFSGTVIANGAIGIGASARFTGRMFTINGGAINIGALACNIDDRVTFDTNSCPN